MSSRVKTLVIPVFRRYWLWNAWQCDQAAHSAITRPTKTWKDGRTLEERFSYLGDQISGKILERLMTEWNKLKAANEGSLKNRLYRLAQAVLSREDPQETFLKSIPTDSAELKIIYPVCGKSIYFTLPVHAPIVSIRRLASTALKLGYRSIKDAMTVVADVYCTALF